MSILDHVTLFVSDYARSKALHVAAIAAGARDFGPPGPRPVYHAHYYGGFVLDFDGHNVEAVVHSPE